MSTTTPPDAGFCMRDGRRLRPVAGVAGRTPRYPPLPAGLCDHQGGVHVTAETPPPEAATPPQDWAQDMADLHAHAAPSLLPRHGDDRATVAAERAVGFSAVVLKAHEGSTVERAAAAGDGAFGGIVLNSPVGGANPDAVEIAARLGGRVVWMPTVSARTHKAGATSPELSVHRGFELRPVDVIANGALLPQWFDVLDTV